MDASTACTAAPTLPLHTTRLMLRPVEPEDAERIVPLAGDWEVARFTTNIPHPLSPRDASDFMTGARSAMAEGSALVLSLIEKRMGDLIGLIGVTWDGERKRGEVGYWLGRVHWNQGFVSEALSDLLTFLFETVGLERLVAFVCVENKASRRVLEKSGFTWTGCVEQPAPARGRSVTMDEFILPREDWLQSRSRTRPLLLVAAVALIDAEGKILVAQRPEGKHMAGLWEFPGGKVDAGETPEAALVRELREELGIDITESCLAPLTFASHAYEDFHLLMPVFACRVWRGTIRSMEGQAFQWVRPNRLGALPMPPADVPLVALIRDLL